jgi:nucleoside-diphosphate-sugar epimerase
MSTKILILGINGFIGSSMAARILHEEPSWEIYGIDLSDHKIKNFLRYQRLYFTKGDACKNFDWVNEHIQKCDVIFPLIAIANPALYVSNPLLVYHLDFEHNMDVVKLCVKYKKHLVFPSTSEVYGMSNDIPFDEESSFLVTGPIHKSRWIYSCSKQLLDRVIHSYGLQENLGYTLFRPFNWIGPNQDEVTSSKDGSARVVGQFLANIMDRKDLNLVDGGFQKRCFTYIEDGIDALIKIIKRRNNEAFKRIFNLGNPNNEYSIKEVAEIMLEIANKYPRLQKKVQSLRLVSTNSERYYGKGYQDVQRRIPSINNAIKYLDWQPKYKIEIALKKIFDHYIT